ncbi:conserved protein of unknown function (plasmid) [Rhodovastum atsumiense]|uniref:Uncharacterized protein n=1 Tax=Rhodovastum atsumiense TaxID=504468 RepID=A0A5M6IU07_9PROT|nr:hypothetical protein [Rhodovastum atsumiense]KAA5611800.1 hypothetical protein F1189_12225 [Rhodovastum atsumiense]CAH2606092.1 conserved protein of unknown function [Rhodovastum atsumiense]
MADFDRWRDVPPGYLTRTQWRREGRDVLLGEQPDHRVAVQGGFNAALWREGQTRPFGGRAADIAAARRQADEQARWAAYDARVATVLAALPTPRCMGGDRAA